MIGKVKSILTISKIENNSTGNYFGYAEIVTVSVDDNLDVTAKIYQDPTCLIEVKEGSLVSITNQIGSSGIYIAQPISILTPKKGMGVLVGDLINGIVVQFVGQEIVIDPIKKTTKVTINSPTVEFSDNIQCKEMECDNIIIGGIDLLNFIQTHTHTSGSPGSPTSPPNL